MALFPTSWSSRLIGIAGLAALVGAFLAMQRAAPPAPSPVAAGEGPRPLRLSGPQFMLNWQSFPGRDVLIEYCTMHVPPNGDATCVVFDGATRLGEIDLDKETLDAETVTWAAANCRGDTLKSACSTRLLGTIRTTTRGRPLLYRAKTVS